MKARLQLAVLLSSLGVACGSPGTQTSGSQPAPSASAAEVRLTIPFGGQGIAVIPFWVALDTGQFKKYGIDVESSFVSGTTIVQTMLSGETPVAWAAETAVIRADLRGGDIMVAGVGTDKMLESLLTPANVKTFEALRGKRLAVTNAGDTSDVAGRFLLNKNGLRPDKDVQFVPLRTSQSAMLAAMDSGAVDAGMIGPPISTIAAKTKDYTILADMADYDVPFYISSLLMKRSWVAEHRDAAVNVVRALVAGREYALNNEARTLQVERKYFKTEDQATLEAAYAAMRKAMAASPVPKVEAVKTALAVEPAPEAKTADPASFIDPSLAADAQKLGT